MSKSGEPVPDLAEVVRAIAQRVTKGEAVKADATPLRRLAELLDGSAPNGLSLRLHFPPNRPRRGSEGVQRRYDMACAIRDYRHDHRCTLPEAYEALRVQFGTASTRALENAWKEMRSVLRLDQPGQSLRLFFMKLEADRPGSVVVKKRARKAA